MTDWFSRLVRHPARKRFGPFLQPRNPHWACGHSTQHAAKWRMFQGWLQLLLNTLGS